MLWVIQLNYPTFQNIFTSQGPQSTRNIIVRFYNFKIFTVEKLMLFCALIGPKTGPWFRHNGWNHRIGNNNKKTTRDLLLIMEYHGIDHLYDWYFGRKGNIFADEECSLPNSLFTPKSSTKEFINDFYAEMQILST